MTGYAWPHPTNSGSVTLSFSLVNISMQNNEDTYCFLTYILMIKKSFNFIGLEHILVYNIKLCLLNCSKNTFVYLENT